MTCFLSRLEIQLKTELFQTSEGAKVVGKRTKCLCLQTLSTEQARGVRRSLVGQDPTPEDNIQHMVLIFNI